MNGQRPAWREPMVWLIAILPLFALAGGIAMIYVAGGSGGGDAVADPVKRTAQVQVSDLGPDAQARRLGLSAIVRVDRNLVEVLPVTGAFDRAAKLRIAFQHPVRAAADRSLLLQPSALGWRSAATLEDGHDWNLELTSQDGRWRLYGRLPKRQKAAHLKPALPSEAATP